MRRAGDGTPRCFRHTNGPHPLCVRIRIFADGVVPGTFETLSSCSKSASVVQRSGAGRPPENHSKVTLVAEARLLGDLCDGQMGCGKQRLSLGNSEMIQIVDERLASNLFEEIHE